MTYNEKTSVEKAETMVRFPNESYAIPVTTFKIEDFETTSIFRDEVFGWWGSIHVAIPRETYDRLKQL